MGVKERKAREFARRENEILETAYHFLVEMEPGQMTMEQIAEKAEIGRGTIYKHFRSKDEIFARLILNRREAFLEKLEKIKKEGVERIPRLIRSYLEYNLEDRQAYAVHKRCDAHCIRENLGLELQAALRDQQNRKVQLVRDILEKALGKDVADAEDVVYYICAAWGMQRGAIDALLDNRFEGAILDEKKYFDSVEQMFLSGIPYMVH